MNGRRQVSTLDARAWLAWGAAMTVPLLTGRHPVVLAELLVIVMVVRTVCLPENQARGWEWLIRIAALAVPLGMLFNVLTVRAGDHKIFSLPSEVPFLGGDLTWNALLYGFISGVTIVTLVAVGTTVAAALDWSSVIRLLPARARNVAVAGSVAWSFLPQLSRSWRDIREAQAARGHRWRGARDIVPLAVPLLAGGLDRSITMAEALESRGFGYSAGAERSLSKSTILIATALTIAVAGLYMFAVGQSVFALAVLVSTAGLAWLGLRSQGGMSTHRQTPYRISVWTRGDTLIVIASMVAMAATIILLQLDPEALRYDPYPDIGVPWTNPFLIGALSVLMLPAVIAPATTAHERRTRQ